MYTRLVNVPRLVNDFWIFDKVQDKSVQARLVLYLVRIQKLLTNLCTFQSLVHLSMICACSCPKLSRSWVWGVGHNDGSHNQNMPVQPHRLTCVCVCVSVSVSVSTGMSHRLWPSYTICTAVLFHQGHDTCIHRVDRLQK